MQTAEVTWILEIPRKSLGLEDRSRRKNLRIIGIKEDSGESRKECENKIHYPIERKNWIWTQAM